MATMKLTIVTPERSFFKGESQGVLLKGPDGYFEVLPRHTDMVAALVPTEIRIKNNNGENQYAFTSSGFVEVTHKGVSIVVDAAEWPNEIDCARCDNSIARANLRLKEKTGQDTLRAELALKRAIARKKTLTYL